MVKKIARACGGGEGEVAKEKDALKVRDVEEGKREEITFGSESRTGVNIRGGGG